MTFLYRALVLFAALSGACSKLPDESPGTCGNGVIDPGEDCDGSPRCMQCALTCPDGACLDAQGHALPSYTCGVDKLCHAPSGMFHGTESGEFPFTPIGELVSDIDADGIGDVVGVSQDVEVVHYGDAAGVLQREATAIIPQETGLPTFTKLDDDQSEDLLVPAADGLAAMTSPAHIPLPFSFTNNAATHASCVTMGGRQPRRVARLDDGHMTIVVADPTTKQVYAGVLDFETETCTEVPACNLMDPGVPNGVGLTSYDISAVTMSSSALVALDDGTSLCVMQIVQTGATTFAITQVASQPWKPQLNEDQPVLALLDGSSPCPSLVTSTPSKTLQIQAGVSTGSGCKLAAATTLTSPAGGPWVPSLRVPIVPQIAGAGPDALVLDSNGGAFPQSSIFAYASGTPVEPALYTSNDSFTEIASADLDGDGVYEVVAAPEIATDVEVLYRTQNPDGFLLARMPTNAAPSHLVLGDYDGNGLADIAYLDTLNAGTALMIAYGTRDRPLPPVPVASFQYPVFAVLPVQVPDSIDPGFKAQDLIVLQDRAATSIADAEVTVLHGSAQRTMFAFYDPRSIVDGNLTMFASAVGGDFFRDTPSSDALVFETPKPGNTIPGCPVQVWEARGLGGGLLDSPPGPLDVCEGTAPAIDYGTCDASTTAKLCGNTARFTAYPLADRDVAIGLDYYAHVVTIDPAQASGGHQPVQSSSALSSFSLANLVNYRDALADLDGDGRAELIVPYRDPNPNKPAHAVVLICAVDASGIVSHCDDLRDLVTADAAGRPMPLAGLDCVDARPGIATPRGRLDALAAATSSDLAVSCFAPNGGSGSVYLVSHATGAYVAHYVLPYDAYFLDLADVTGDGVDDLLLLSFFPAPIFHVYPQCDARDRTCQGGQ